TGVHRIDSSQLDGEQLPTGRRNRETETDRVRSPSKRMCIHAMTYPEGREHPGGNSMHPYDSRRLTLDPGLTVLAVRGLGSGDGCHLSIERPARWRRTQAGIRPRVAAWFPTVRTLLPARPTTG